MKGFISEVLDEVRYKDIELTGIKMGSVDTDTFKTAVIDGVATPSEMLELQKSLLLSDFIIIRCDFYDVGLFSLTVGKEIK